MGIEHSCQIKYIVHAFSANFPDRFPPPQAPPKQPHSPKLHEGLLLDVRSRGQRGRREGSLERWRGVRGEAGQRVVQGPGT